MKKERNAALEDRVNDRLNMNRSYQKEIKDEKERAERILIQAKGLEIENSTLNEPVETAEKEKRKLQN